MNDQIELLVEYPSYYLDVEDELDIDLLVECSEEILELATTIVVKKYEGESYEGDYTVNPTASRQILYTEAKNMSSNLIINSIPYREESNTAGTTIYIACEDN